MVNCRKCGDDLGGCPDCKPLARIEPDYPVADAGRALVRCFRQDRMRTLADLMRLREKERGELARAYVQYWTRHGGTARMTDQEVMQTWRASAIQYGVPMRVEDEEEETTNHDASIIGLARSECTTDTRSIEGL